MTDSARRSSGFTAIELLVTISMIGILTALGLPSFNEWIVNQKIRTTAETLQNSLRLAQAEAVRRNRQVMFVLTNSNPGDADPAAADDARNWVIQSVLAFSGDQVEFIQGGTFSEQQGGIAVSGLGATCFNSIGRVVPNATVGCTVPTGSTGSTLRQFRVTAATSPANYRELRVTVSIGGQVRMCDASRAASTASDGCPQ